MGEQWCLHCTSQWRVVDTYLVSMCTVWPLHSKWLSRVEQWICIKFWVKFEHSSAETILMIQKATAVGNWWLAASWWHCAHSCIMSYADFFGETSCYPGNSAPVQLRFSVLQLLAFPTTKITFERAEISGCQWDSGKYDGNWENCVRSQCACFERYWGIIVLCTTFLVSFIFFNKWLYFSYYMAGYLLDRPHIVLYLWAWHLSFPLSSPPPHSFAWVSLLAGRFSDLDSSEVRFLCVLLVSFSVIALTTSPSYCYSPWPCLVYITDWL